MKYSLIDPFILYGHSFTSRLLLGSSNYPSLEILSEVIKVSTPAMVTVALRRLLANNINSHVGLFEVLKAQKCLLLPNTAGCHSTEEAYNTAQMAREVFETNWIKLELVGDDYTYYPNSFKLVKAAEQLIADGFKVMPYCTEDLVVAQQLIDVGCQTLMPWAAPIGTGKGILNKYGLRILRERIPTNISLIIDAGLGLPSHACQVLEYGYDGILLNTAISQANNPIIMASAFTHAVLAGRSAYLGGPMTTKEIAHASTTIIDKPFWHYNN